MAFSSPTEFKFSLLGLNPFFSTTPFPAVSKKLTETYRDSLRFCRDLGQTEAIPSFGVSSAFLAAILSNAGLLQQRETQRDCRVRRRRDHREHRDWTEDYTEHTEQAEESTENRHRDHRGSRRDHRGRRAL